MNSMTYQANTLSPLYMPRGARVAADLFGRLLMWMSGESSNSLAQSRADEAEHVRDMAQRYEATDPGFASDLYAAAARHESIGETV